MSDVLNTSEIRFSSPDGLPEEYKSLLVRMLSIQSRIESEYMLAADRTLMKPLALAPTPEDKAEYAAFWSDEVRHASYWMKLLSDLGVTVDEKFMSSPMPIYVFEMRDQAADWIEYGLFSFFADRQGAYMGYEWVGCSYEPLGFWLSPDSALSAARRRTRPRAFDQASGAMVSGGTRYVRAIGIEAPVRLRQVGSKTAQQRADARRIHRGSEYSVD
jgi:hypothetical protein